MVVKLLYVISVFLLSTLAQAGPLATTYQAKIIKPDGYPLEASNVIFKFTILNPAATCVLYSETYSTVNMANTAGVISFALGSGVKTYPVSATTFKDVFSNITPSLSCDTGGPVSYSPQADDVRKIVMQFNDGSGWQTLPAMAINAVPYAMYAEQAQKLNGFSDIDFVKTSTLVTCGTSEALRYNGAGFSCVAVGSAGAITSGDITTALGYMPAAGASVTALTSSLNTTDATLTSVSSTVFSVSSTVTSLSNTVAASFAAMTSSQWSNVASGISYTGGNVGIGTSAPTSAEGRGLHIYNDLNTGTVESNSSVSIQSVNRNAILNLVGAGLSNTGASINFRDSSPSNQISQGVIRYDFTPRDLVMVTSGTEKLRITGSGNVGIGTVAPTSKLHLIDTIAVSSGSYTAHSTTLSVNPSSLTSASIWGLKTATNYISSIGTTGPGAIRGAEFAALNMNTASLGTAYGVVGTAQNNSAGSISAAQGVYGYVSNTSSGSINSAYGGYFGVRNTGAGVVTNSYGLYIGIVEGTNKWSIYAADTLASSYFGGNVGIGLTTPTAKLHLAAGTSATAPLKIQTGVLLTSPQSGTIEYDGSYLYVTDSSNIRRTIATGSAAGSIDNASVINNSSGNIVLNPNSGSNSVIVSSTVASANSSTGALVVGGGLGVAGNINAGGTINGVSVTATSGMISPYIAGSISSGESLTLDSTTHTTKGHILLAPNGGNVGIGTVNPDAKLVVNLNSAYVSAPANTGIHVVGADSLNALITLDSAGASPKIVGRRASNTIASPNAVLNGNYLLSLEGHGYTGTSYSTTPRAQIVMAADQNWSGSGQGTLMFFSTTASGATTASERMRITNSGNVGIGTSAPAMTVDVQATTNAEMRLKNTGDSDPHFFFDANRVFSDRSVGSLRGAWNGNVIASIDMITGLDTTNKDEGYLQFKTRDSVDGSVKDRMTIAQNGNVGIGTTSPWQKLDVSGATVTNTLHLGIGRSAGGFNSISETGTGVKGRIYFGAESSDQASIYSEVAAGSVTGLVFEIKDDPTDYFSFNNQSGPLMRIYQDGNVGIGTTYPQNRLDVNKTSPMPNAIDSDSNNFINAAAFRVATEFDSGGNALYFGNSDVANARTSWLQVGHRNSAYASLVSTSELALQPLGGNVGIGTSSPQNLLHIYGAGSTTSKIESGASATAQLALVNANRTWSFGTRAGGNLYVTDETSSTYRMTFDTSGNVGIGTSAPTEKLQVAGNIFANGGSVVGNSFAFSGWQGSLSGSGVSGASYISLNTSATSRLHITHAGNVGIGTTSPTYTLDVSGTVNAKQILLNGADISNSASAWSVSGSNVYRSSGKVGIGTSNPSTTLDVRDSVGDSVIQVGNPSISGNHRIQVNAAGVGTFGGYYLGNRAALVLNTSNGNNLKIGGDGIGTNFTSQSFYTSGTEKIRIDSEGNVGIGTGNPARRLDVYAPAGNGNVMGLRTNDYVLGASGSTMTFQFGTASGNTYGSINVLSNGGVVGNDLILQAAGGNVGIGTSAPTQRLHVVGNLRVEGSTDCILGNGAGGTNCSSDARLKENIKPIPYALDKVLSLKGVEFDWNQKSASFGRHDIGVIAQDVEKVFPTAVINDKDSGFKKVDYAVLVAPVIEAMKTLYQRLISVERSLASVATEKADQREVEILKEKVKEIDAVKAENAALKSYLCSKDPTAPICK